MRTLWQDVRYGARAMRANPGFTLVAVVALALGVGANTAIFSVVNAVLLRPLQYPNAERVVVIQELNPEGRRVQVTPANFLDWREQAQTFEHMAAILTRPANLAAGEEAERVDFAMTSVHFFDVFGVRPRVGRFFLPEEEKAGHAPVAVLSHSLWQRRFGADPSVVGRSVTLDGRAYEVVGVAPGGFSYPDRTEVWVPPYARVPTLSEQQDVSRARGFGFLSAVALLKSGETLEHARAEMETITARLRQQYPESNTKRFDRVETLHENLVGESGRALLLLLGAVALVLLIACANVANLLLARAAGRQKEMAVRVALGATRLRQQYPESNTKRFDRVETLHEHLVGESSRALLLLLGAVALVLLIACANVANLLLARAAGRQKELALRVALGATRLRLVRQLLVESVLLALAGGAAGLLLGWWGVDLLKGLLPAEFPRLTDVGVDPGVLGFTLLVSCATGLAFGLAPALQFTKPDVYVALKESARGSTGGARGGRLRSLLIVSEVALSLVLLVGAGLLFRSFLTLRAVELGFRPQSLLTFRLTPAGERFREDTQYTAFYRDVAERVAALPGVEAVGLINTLPLVKGPTTGFQVEGRPLLRRDQRPSVNYRSVSPDYFRAAGIAVVKGRVPDARDTDAAPLVLAVNQALARRDFPDEDPVGKRISYGVGPDGQPIWKEIVGVVADVRSEEPGREAAPEIYASYLQDPFAGMSYVVRSTVEPESLAPAVREAVRAVDKAQPVAEVRTMEQLVGESVAQPRFNSLLLGIFAGMALVLAAAGIYGVMSYAVTQRTHEIGIRIALGAQGRDVLRLVVGRGMALALAGVGLGLVAALALTRLMAGLLYGVTATDPMTYAGVALLLSAVALLASYLPARRATKVDPMVALRYE